MNQRPDLQSFGREARRLLRHTSLALSMDEREYLGDLTAQYVRTRLRRPSLPKSISRHITQFVRRTQRSIDNDGHPAGFHKEYSEMLLGALRLLTGHFCGQVSPMYPTLQCSICLCLRGGRWWFSWDCGHSFHLKCIAPHIKQDNRCPLCRAEFLW